jgi:predicted RND superfamily exporter protein
MTMNLDDGSNDFPVVADPKDFDTRSGSLLERIIFNHRRAVVCIFVLVASLLGIQALHLVVNANFERMIPRSHPYIRNYLDHKVELRGLGNSIRIVVENTRGDIYDPEYLAILRKVNDTAYLMRGVDRPWMKSLWMPFVRWSEVVEDGLDGGPVMPDNFSGSPQDIEQLRNNVARAGIVGLLVAENYKSSIVQVPLLDRYADTGKPLDYGAFSREIEQKIRSMETAKIKIHIVGFAKLVGDLIEGLGRIVGFFAASALIATAFLFMYTRCIRSTLLLVTIALLGVVCQLGAMHLLGYELDPYSILSPFLIFAIGLSHGAQKMNGIMQDVGRGTHKYVAARYTFRRLFMAGLTALLTNVVGFAVLMTIDIPVIKDLALTTSLGVFILIFTKLFMIPVALSYIGVSPVAAARSIRGQGGGARAGGVFAKFMTFLNKFTGRGWALAAIMVTAVLAVVAFSVSQHIQIGDLDQGAPELRPDSRYNRNSAYVTAHYGQTADQFAVIVKTPKMACDSYTALLETGRLAWELEHLEGVQGTTSLYSKEVRMLAATNEGNPKWATLYHQDKAIGTASQRVMSDEPDAINPNCSIVTLVAYLSDHKAATLDRVLKTVEKFGREHNQPELEFLPAAGSSGIEAITNIVVKESNTRMLIILYSATALLCFVTFRNWRAVVIALIPLILTSVLCEALMVWLGIGIKVATLPVIALGVGVGVDYALYLLSIQLALQRRGESLADAYGHALQFTGKVVALVGVTMAAGVVTWAWSPIKFQADMGILLTFMFFWNMIGALILIPALSHFLLRKVPNNVPKGQ